MAIAGAGVDIRRERGGIGADDGGVQYCTYNGKVRYDVTAFSGVRATTSYPFGPCDVARYTSRVGMGLDSLNVYCYAPHTKEAISHLFQGQMGNCLLCMRCITISMQMLIPSRLLTCTLQHRRDQMDKKCLLEPLKKLLHHSEPCHYMYPSSSGSLSPRSRRIHSSIAETS
jgi:hypothetical protein